MGKRAKRLHVEFKAKAERGLPASVVELFRLHPDLREWQDEITHRVNQIETSEETRKEIYQHMLNEKLHHLADAIEALENLNLKKSDQVDEN